MLQGQLLFVFEKEKTTFKITFSVHYKCGWFSLSQSKLETKTTKFSFILYKNLANVICTYFKENFQQNEACCQYLSILIIAAFLPKNVFSALVCVSLFSQYKSFF